MFGLRRKVKEENMKRMKSTRNYYLGFLPVEEKIKEKENYNFFHFHGWLCRKFKKKSCT